MVATSSQLHHGTRLAWMAALVLALASSFSGCGPATQPGVPGSAGTGATSEEPVRIDGSSTVYPISREAMQTLSKANPDVKIIVDKSGTGGGFGKYLDNKIDIVDASRGAKPEEEAKARAQGLDWERFVVGYDGITVVVNPKNSFVKELSVPQLKKLWEPGSKIKTWKNLDPTWPDRKINFYCPDEDSGTFEFFTEKVMGKAKSQREDVQPSSDDNTLVKGVANDEDGIGYFGLAYYLENDSILRAIPIKATADASAVMPDPDYIRDKTYVPLSRPLYIYVKKSSMRRPTVRDFVKYYIENVKSLAEKTRYVAPTDEDDQANKTVLSALLNPTGEGDASKKTSTSPDAAARP